MTDVLIERPVEGDEDTFDKEAPIPDGRPNIHAKHISLIITAGTEDREQSIEDLLTAVQVAVAQVPGVKRVFAAGQYYILDGKVCLPDDYDPKTQGFKEGAAPPPWAGGPAPKHEKPKSEPIGRSPVDVPSKKTKKSEPDPEAEAVKEGMSKVTQAVAEAAAAREENDDDD